jgi:hypothetical protein
MCKLSRTLSCMTSSGPLRRPPGRPPSSGMRRNFIVRKSHPPEKPCPAFQVAQHAAIKVLREDWFTSRQTTAITARISPCKHRGCPLRCNRAPLYTKIDRAEVFCKHFIDHRGFRQAAGRDGCMNKNTRRFASGGCFYHGFCSGVAGVTLWWNLIFYRFHPRRPCVNSVHRSSLRKHR